MKDRSSFGSLLLATFGSQEPVVNDGDGLLQMRVQI